MFRRLIKWLATRQVPDNVDRLVMISVYLSELRVWRLAQDIKDISGGTLIMDIKITNMAKDKYISYNIKTEASKSYEWMIEECRRVLKIYISRYPITSFKSAVTLLPEELR